MKYRVDVKFHKDFIEVSGGEIAVGVMARPEKGKANEEIVKKIAKHFGVPKSAVRIVSGATSRKKIVEVG
ncbi:MAG: DUF167 domain-containing protein [bacterium]|nr:DUF167 domain-containing protein [bacterium]